MKGSAGNLLGFQLLGILWIYFDEINGPLIDVVNCPSLGVGRQSSLGLAWLSSPTFRLKKNAT